MSDFRPMTECKGFNMERVLLKNKNGYMITAYFKDGMLKCDGDEDWTQPITWDSFIRLQDLVNGASAKDRGLHLQNVSLSLKEDAKDCLIALSYWDEHEFKDSIHPNHKLKGMPPMIITKKLLKEIINEL